MWVYEVMHFKMWENSKECGHWDWADVYSTLETVERRSCLSSANFPYLPVVETPPTQSQLFFGDGRQEEEVGKDGIKSTRKGYLSPVVTLQAV
ncbi:hypothetical protein NQZ68_031490 [Dissostichus eleginoides]|nr:hypothetical protein NQZ68_031490 [Dissostichus eleginoides]